MNKKAIIYYSTATFVSLTIVFSAVWTLSWPVMAEIPIAISLFIQLLAASKYIFINVIERKGITANKIWRAFTEVQSNSPAS